LVWFVVEFLSIDYDILCFWILEKTPLCLEEPILDIGDSIKDWAEKISLLILGFFIFDLGYRAAKIGWRNSLHDRQYWFDIVITMPFFWLFEPWEFMITLRVLKVIRISIKFYKAYKKAKRLKQN